MDALDFSNRIWQLTNESTTAQVRHRQNGIVRYADRIFGDGYTVVCIARFDDAFKKSEYRIRLIMNKTIVESTVIFVNGAPLAEWRKKPNDEAIVHAALLGLLNDPL